jgi:hypothetical protein
MFKQACSILDHLPHMHIILEGEKRRAGLRQAPQFCRGLPLGWEKQTPRNDDETLMIEWIRTVGYMRSQFA